jgi:4-amino-4-deoxy-L-arabinose transferase-like glycosyltransferase
VTRAVARFRVEGSALAVLVRSRTRFLFLAALVLLGNLFWIARLEPRAYWSDEEWYLSLARAIAGGQSVSDPTGRPPGTSLFLAAWSVFGDSWPVFRLSNLVLALVAGVVAHRLTLRLHGHFVAARLSALAVLGYPFFVHLRGFLLSENLSILAVLVVAWCLLATVSSQRILPWLGTGIVTGVSCLARPVLILMPIFLPLVLRRVEGGSGKWRQILGRGGLFATGMAIVLVGWLLHNRSLTGRWELTSKAGFELYKGVATPPGEQISTFRGAAEGGGSKGALDWIREHPLQALRNKAYYAFRFWWPGLDHADEEGGQRSLAVLAWAVLVPLYLLALFGAMRARRGPRVVILVLILAYWTFHVVTVVKFRYRIPVDGLLLCLAAGGLLRSGKSEVAASSHRTGGAPLVGVGSSKQ